MATAKLTVQILVDWNDIKDHMAKSDIVEVVRCRDCKWFGKVGCAIMIVDDYDKPTEDDYCSFAERREDGKG